MPLYFCFLFQLLASGLNAAPAPEPMPSSDICITYEQYQEVETLVRHKRRQLISAGILPTNYNGRMAPPAFIWPIKQAAGFNYPSYYSVNNFVDLDPAVGSTLDWNCGTRTYDGHRGIDINNWPFWWHMMDNDQVEAVAAAPGTIIAKVDGNPDRNCSCIEPWNVIMIEHEDGYQSWYAHLKSGSQTTKGVGETVVAGEYLGIIGSAGCSSNPHLHFEVRDPEFNVIEPYVGSCNTLATGSLWADQKPYREGTLNKLFTHSAAPSLEFCPENEVTNFQDNFSPGDLAHFAAYYHDQQSGEQTSFEIRDPMGALIADWTHTSPGTYNGSWWWWSWFIPENGIAGTWQFIGDYNGQEVIQYFTVGCEPEITIDPVTIEDEQQFSAAQTITTNGTVAITGNGSVVMSAGESILLTSGFSVTSGGELFAFIEDCSAVSAFTVDHQNNEPAFIPDSRSLNTPESEIKDVETSALAFQMHPNPAREHFQLEYRGVPENETVTIEIYDLNGRIMQRLRSTSTHSGLHSVELSTRGLAGQLYLVHLKTAHEQSIQRLLIHR